MTKLLMDNNGIINDVADEAYRFWLGESYKG